MKVSVNWLKELVAIEMDVDDLAHTLTMAGLEVEEVVPVAPPFDHVVVAEVKSTTPHPNADKLRVCEVDAGNGAILQVVCGAPNVAPGLRVPCALVGARLPSLEIKRATLRGIESNGMLCSGRELGLSEDHGGLLILPAHAPIGQDIRVYLDLDDVYLTLKMTPNRGDCLSMVGIARDLAAVTGALLKIPSIPVVQPTADDSRAIRISAPDACGNYLGRIVSHLNTKAETPDWMKRRLERAGFRSIAPLVDITNYIMLERGRPMHAFDNDKLQGSINVRFADAGEEMVLLNEQQVRLTPDMLMIAHDQGPVGMGGVMGGIESMVTPDTKHVFFESAYFDPAAIQGKARLLGLNSDAAYRFERGVDPESARDGIEYATRLAIDICGTVESKVGPVVEANGNLPSRAAVYVHPDRVVRLIGMPISTDEMTTILKRLKCKVESENGQLEVTPPGYRFDLNIEEDFVEEIARVHGYENIPAKAPVFSLPMTGHPEYRRSRHHVRHLLATLGYQEVVNYSFTPESWELDLAANQNALKLANPIASHMSVMRSTLMGGLIASLRHNLDHGEDRLKLFEIGRCFLADEASMSAQPERLGGLVYGERFPEQWGEGGQNGKPADFFSVKGELESLLANGHLRFERLTHPALHPGRAAEIRMHGERVGFLGELHPQWQQKYDLPRTPVLFEIDCEAATKGHAVNVQTISRMQSIRRDIALLVDESVNQQTMVDAVMKRKPESVVDFSIFDVYRGQNLVPGKKSVAFRIVMQDTDRTLTDSEADSKVSEIVNVLYKEVGATLRK